MADKPMRLVIDLTDREALDLAQHLKRAGFNTYADTAENEAETYRQMNAAGKVQQALTRAGYSPR